MKTFDAIVIGSGQGGTPLAKKLAKAGWQTALIEKRFVGGTCTNDGCTPTKALIASAKRAFDLQHSGDLGIINNGFTVDFAAVMKRKNNIVQAFRGAAEEGLAETENLRLIYGEAFFSGKKEITVNLKEGGTNAFTAKHIFINTGTVPDLPPVEGLSDVPYLTSTSLLDVTELPDHLVILGGGYVAIEFAQMFRRFGSRVTVISNSHSLMPNEDTDTAEAILGFLTKEGIQVELGADTKRASFKAGLLRLDIEQGASRFDVAGSHLLVATGRRPDTQPLQLHIPGVEINEEGFIHVNEFLETSAEGIYALGDINGGPAFTHIAYNDHIILLKNLLHQEKLSVKGRPVPYTMFTDPQLGRIGITEKEAHEKGLKIEVVHLPMKKVARAIETAQTTGFMKAIIDAESRQILGAAVLGPEGGEVMTVIQMAMMAKMDAETVRENIFAHPLYVESLNNLFAQLDN